MAEFFVFLLVLVGLSYPLGRLVYRLLEREHHYGPELWVYKLTGVRPDVPMNWRQYLTALLGFNLVGLLVVYALQRAQAILPGNPLHLAAVDPYLAFNTASSFASNTNWQSYGGETTMSWATQMLALTTQNFVSAATGIAAMMALCRGLRRTETRELGNFWVDLTRATATVLLPLSLALALLLVSQGVPQTLSQGPAIKTMEKAETLIPVGPVASQVAIKQLGTNGGGFYNVNSAHPLENPTPLSNFLECLAILLLPAALCHTYALAVGDRRQGWAILSAMLLLFVPLTLICMHAEVGNWEGKEVRFGEAASALWACATTAASNGSVNCMHDSLTALGGLIPMIFMLFGEVVFGGVGCYQAVGHQRWRVLQRELGPSVGESHSAEQLSGVPGHFAAAGRALPYLRAGSRRQAPGLGYFECHAVALRAADFDLHARRGGQLGGQGSALRRGCFGSLGLRYHRRQQRIGQLHA